MNTDTFQFPKGIHTNQPQTPYIPSALLEMTLGKESTYWNVEWHLENIPYIAVRMPKNTQSFWGVTINIPLIWRIKHKFH